MTHESIPHETRAFARSGGLEVKFEPENLRRLGSANLHGRKLLFSLLFGLPFAGGAVYLSRIHFLTPESETMNADALSLETGVNLAPALAAIAGNARKRSVGTLNPVLRTSALLDAAVAVSTRAPGAIESSPTMPKAAAQPGSKTDRHGGKLTQAQLDARALQRTEDDELIREA